MYERNNWLLQNMFARSAQFADVCDVRVPCRSLYLISFRVQAAICIREFRLFYNCRFRVNQKRCSVTVIRPLDVASVIFAMLSGGHTIIITASSLLLLLLLVCGGDRFQRYVTLLAFHITRRHWQFNTDVCLRRGTKTQALPRKR